MSYEKKPDLLMKARRRRYSIKRITGVYTPTKSSSSTLPEEMTEPCKKGTANSGIGGR